MLLPDHGASDDNFPGAVRHREPVAVPTLLATPGLTTDEARRRLAADVDRRGPPADDRHRASTPRRQRHRDRTQQQAGDPAEAAVADHDQLRRSGLVQQPRNRKPVENLLLDRDARRLLGGGPRGVRQVHAGCPDPDLVDVRPGPRIGVLVRQGRRVDRLHHAERCLSATRLPGRPSHGLLDDSHPSTPTTTGRPACCTSIATLLGPSLASLVRRLERGQRQRALTGRTSCTSNGGRLHAGSSKRWSCGNGSTQTGAAGSRQRSATCAARHPALRTACPPAAAAYAIEPTARAESNGPGESRPASVR